MDQIWTEYWPNNLSSTTWRIILDLLKVSNRYCQFVITKQIWNWSIFLISIQTLLLLVRYTTKTSKTKYLDIFSVKYANFHFLVSRSCLEQTTLICTFWKEVLKWKESITQGAKCYSPHFTNILIIDYCIIIFNFFILTL